MDLAAAAKPDSWQVGQVRVTRVVDTETDFPLARLFGDLPRQRVLDTQWLHPHYARPDGDLKISTHAFVLESQGRRIVVDTCIGNDKPRSAANFNQLSTPFLDRLAAAGYAPEDIDIVMCTHLHVDHVGWNTRWDGTAWVPTFPNAHYLFGRIEWEHWQDLIPRATDPHDLERSVYFQDSIKPVVDAGLSEFIETDHRITDEVTLFHTPGHTPGHVSVRILSDGREAIITGDAMHHPIQIADAEICSNFDSDVAAGEATRRALVARVAGTETLLLGTHFARPSGGWVVREGNRWRFAQSPESSS